MTEKTKEVRLAVTVKVGQTYHKPGTKITLPEKEADAMVEKFGAFDGPEPVKHDPGDTNAIGVDEASIAALNEHNAIHNRDAIRAIGDTDSDAEDEDDGEKTLEDMTKDELVEYAKDNQIEVNPAEKKADILAAIKKAEAGPAA